MRKHAILLLGLALALMLALAGCGGKPAQEWQMAVDEAIRDAA